MSLLKTNSVQIGQSITANQNFALSTPASPDGTIKLSRGNAGNTTQDIFLVDANGTFNVNTMSANVVSANIFIGDGSLLSNVASPISDPFLPSTISPANNAIDIGSGLVSLNVSLEITGYISPSGIRASNTEFQVSDDSAFSNVVFDSGELNGIVPSISISTSQYFQVSTVYYWRARYKNINGIYSDWTATSQFTTASALGIPLELLVVSGGGGGGSRGTGSGGGGGGGGGTLYCCFSTDKSYSMQVAIGGGGAAGAQTTGATGGASCFSINSLLCNVSTSGGGGGGRNCANGAGGGSGGGGGNSPGVGGAGISGQGNNGANGPNVTCGGGGGGKCSAGFVRSGGSAASYTIEGTSISYAGGGQGGPGGTSSTVCGGGGGGGGNPTVGGAGQAGIVIVSYPTSFPALTVGAGLCVISSIVGSNRVYCFQSGADTVSFLL
jgi:hypothetical protein